MVEAPLKTKNSYRTISLGTDAVGILKEQRKKCGGSEYVFPSPTGGAISPDGVIQMLHRVLKRAGLPKVRFHDLRHPYVKYETKFFYFTMYSDRWTLEFQFPSNIILGMRASPHGPIT